MALLEVGTISASNALRILDFELYYYKTMPAGNFYNRLGVPLGLGVPLAQTGSALGADRPPRIPKNLP